MATGKPVPVVRGSRNWLRLQVALNPCRIYRRALRELGDAFALPHTDAQDVCYFSDPGIVAEIFRGDPDVFRAGEANSFFKPFGGEHSILVLDGGRHRRQRSAVAPALHGKRVDGMGEEIATAVREVADQTAESAKGAPVQLMEVFAAVTRKIMTRLLFGTGESGLQSRLQAGIQAVHEQVDGLTVLGVFFPFLQKDLGRWSPFGRYLRLQHPIDAILHELIARRKSGGGPAAGDVLEMLLAARDEDGGPLSRQTIRDQLVTLILTAQDTTAIGLSWVFRWLGSRPDLSERLRRDLASHRSQEDASRDASLDRVVKEALRIYPVFLTAGRRVSEDVVLGGRHLVPRGNIAAPFIFGVHHREDLFPDSFRFRPERFAEREFSAFEYFPFGGGARQCPGAALARQVIKVTTAVLFREFEVGLRCRGEPVAVRRAVAMAPRGGVRATLRRR